MMNAYEITLIVVLCVLILVAILRIGALIRAADKSPTMPDAEIHGKPQPAARLYPVILSSKHLSQVYQASTSEGKKLDVTPLVLKKDPVSNRMMEDARTNYISMLFIAGSCYDVYAPAVIKTDETFRLNNSMLLLWIKPSTRLPPFGKEGGVDIADLESSDDSGTINAYVLGV